MHLRDVIVHSPSRHRPRYVVVLRVGRVIVVACTAAEILLARIALRCRLSSRVTAVTAAGLAHVYLRTVDRIPRHVIVLRRDVVVLRVGHVSVSV